MQKNKFKWYKYRCVWRNYFFPTFNILKDNQNLQCKILGICIYKVIILVIYFLRVTLGEEFNEVLKWNFFSLSSKVKKYIQALKKCISERECDLWTHLEKNSNRIAKGTYAKNKDNLKILLSAWIWELEGSWTTHTPNNQVKKGHYNKKCNSSSSSRFSNWNFF